jgi:hypothetical protein
MLVRSVIKAGLSSKFKPKRKYNWKIDRERGKENFLEQYDK